MSKRKTIIYIECAILSIALIIIATMVIMNYIHKQQKVPINLVAIGNIGNKISVDGNIAYVAGENKILVPYDFSGDFNSCTNAAQSKNLKGCTNPRLPINETDDLPEEVAREIISFYGDIGGFWTSLSANHSSIEIEGVSSGSLHYAGVMTNYFLMGNDGVMELVWGYYLESKDDTNIMGLLVLYDVLEDFEFVDVEDTADTNYSLDSIFEESDIQEEQFYSSYTESSSSNLMNDKAVNCIPYPLPCGKYTLTHIFSPFVGWIKTTDSSGNYSDSWKNDEMIRIREANKKQNLISADRPFEIEESDTTQPTYNEDVIQKHSEFFEDITSNMYIVVTDEWIKSYNIYNELDLYKGYMSKTIYKPDDESYDDMYDKRSKVDSTMGKYQIFDVEAYKLSEDGLAFRTNSTYTFFYYPEVNGIGIFIKDTGNNICYKLLFTLQ